MVVNVEKDQDRMTDRFTPEKMLGLKISDNLNLIKKIESGLAFGTLIKLGRTSGLSLENLRIAVGIKQRTLTRRKSEKKLTREESDRLVSVSRLLGQTFELFEGNHEAARQWFTSPNRALGGCSPLEVAATETGAREVENLIGRLEHGVFT